MLTEDQTQLENAFDVLHGHYVKQKETNKKLVNQVKEAESYLTELREWHQQASEKYSRLVKEIEVMKDE